jgi:hypothetical protein
LPGARYPNYLQICCLFFLSIVSGYQEGFLYISRFTVPIINGIIEP